MNCKPGDLALLVLEEDSPLRGLSGRIVSLTNDPPIYLDGLWHWTLTARQSTVLADNVLQDGLVYLAGTTASMDIAPDMNLRPVRGDGNQGTRRTATDGQAVSEFA